MQFRHLWIALHRLHRRTQRSKTRAERSAVLRVRWLGRALRHWLWRGVRLRKGPQARACRAAVNCTRSAVRKGLQHWQRKLRWRADQRAGWAALAKARARALAATALAALALHCRPRRRRVLRRGSESGEGVRVARLAEAARLGALVLLTL